VVRVSFITCSIIKIKSKEVEVGRECSITGGEEECMYDIGGKYRRNDTTGKKDERRWVDNIKSDLRGIERDGMVWIDVAQDRDQWSALVNTVMYLPSGSIECCSIGDSSRRIGSVSECEVVPMLN
jgi:hypothetical protein